MVLLVTAAEHLESYELKLAFNNGVTGVADLSKALWGEMFAPLSDRVLFSQIRLDPELGIIGEAINVR